MIKKYKDIQSNLLQLKEHSIDSLNKFPCKYIAVIKANAYNHEAFLQANHLNDNDLVYLAIGRFEEGILLRKKGVTSNLLLLGHHNKFQLPVLIKQNITPVISNMNQFIDLIQLLQQTKQTLNIWLKFDTGMRRLGFLSNELDKIFNYLNDNYHIQVIGIMTHLSNADDKNCSFSNIQLNHFLDILDKWKTFRAFPKYLSFSNSSTLLNFNCIFQKSTRNRLLSLLNSSSNTFLLHRIGIALYGQSPSLNLSLTHKIKILQNWKTKIIQIKNKNIFIPVGFLDFLHHNWPYVKINNKIYIIKDIFPHFSIIDAKNDFIPIQSDVTLLSKKKEPKLSKISETTQISSYELLNCIKNNSYNNQESLQDFQLIDKRLTNSQIFIYKKNLIHNYSILSKLFKFQKICINLEYNSYGLGTKEVLSVFKNFSNTPLICQSFVAALSLRKHYQNPIHCLESLNDLQAIHMAIKNNIAISIYNESQLNFLMQLNQNDKNKVILYCSISIKDTHPGLNIKIVNQLKLFKNVHVYTYYDKNIKTALTELKYIYKKFNTQFIYHLYNCENIQSIPNWITSVAHPFALYGCHKNFKSVLKWTCQISQTKIANKGDYISYGNTYQFKNNSQFAVLPIGYADGFPNDPIRWPFLKSFNNTFKIIGKVCMDQCMILDEHYNLRTQQSITIIGNGLSIKTISKLMKVSPLVIMARLSKRISRFINYS